MLTPEGQDSPSNFMPTISSDPIVDIFSDFPLQAYNFFPSATDFASRSLEAELNVGAKADPFYTQTLRANYDSSYLALGFAKPTEDFECLVGAFSG